MRAYQKIGSLKRLKTLTLNGIEFKNGEFLNHVTFSKSNSNQLFDYLIRIEKFENMRYFKFEFEIC